MRAVFFLFSLMMSLSGMAEVKQYFRYVDDGVIKVGMRDGVTNYTFGECENIDCFLQITKGEVAGELVSEVFFETLQLSTPVPSPKQIIAPALNFTAHKEETKLAEFVIFPKITALTPWNAPVPHYGDGKGLLDYEVELGFLINKDITAEDLKNKNVDLGSFIAGVFLTLDMTSRELQVREGTLFNSYKGFSIAKSLPGYAPCGQFFISYKDFLSLASNFKISLDLNGENRQSSNLEDMINSPEEVLRLSFLRKYSSRKYSSSTGKKVKIHNGTIFKGDVLLSGTPAGMLFVAPTSKDKMAGFFEGLKKGKNPIKYAKDKIVNNQPKHLVPGDVIEATGSYLGQISTSVISVK